MTEAGWFDKEKQKEDIEKWALQKAFICSSAVGSITLCYHMNIIKMSLDGIVKEIPGMTTDSFLETISA